MPTAWFQRRSVLALSLFFPWFPFSPLSPPAAELPTVALKAGVAGEPKIAAPAPEEPLVLPGVVIEEIPKGSALEKAGLQVGDVILSWQRLPNPPANPEATEGVLTSYFDWLELEVEQVPRGAVRLHGLRGGTPRELRIEPGIWNAKVRPVLPPALAKIFERGKDHLAARDFERAAETWRTLANNVPAGDVRELRAWVLLQIGEAWGKNREWQKSLEAAKGALAAARSAGAQMAAWEAIGGVYERSNDPESAKRAYQSADEVINKLGSKELRSARSHTNLGAMAWGRGDLRRAYDLFERALAIREKLAPRSLELAASLNDLGVLNVAIGDLKSANELLKRSLALREQLAPGSLVMADSLSNLGAAARAQGDLSRAVDYYTQALQVRQARAPNGLEAANSLSSLGIVAWSRGDLDSARYYFLNALSIETAYAPLGDRMAASLNNLGLVAASRRELDRAKEYFLQAQQIQSNLAPAGSAMASILNNLGSIADDLGDSERARAYHRKALKMWKQIGSENLALADVLVNLGNIEIDLGRLSTADSYYSQALILQGRLAPDSLYVAKTLHLMGLTMFKRGSFGEAQAYFSRALSLQEQLAPRGIDFAGNLNNLGDVARAQGETGRALDYYARALVAFENQILALGGSYNVQAAFRARYPAYYRDMLTTLLSQGRFPEAMHTLERFRAQTFLIMLAERDTAFTADIPEELDRERRRLGVLYDRTLKKLARLNLHDNGEEIETTRRELQRLDGEAGDLEVRIRKASPRLAALKYPHPLDTAEVQQTLDPGTLLLSYSVGKEKTALFALSRTGNLEVKILPLGEAALRSKVQRLMSLIRESAQSSSLGELRRRRLQAASRELYTALLGPVEKRISASERLLILPDGPLHVLPFAALVRGGGADAKRGGQYLAEWKPVHVALSATVFAELKQRRRPASEDSSPQAPIQLAAFGDPVYPQSLTKAKGVSVAALPTATELKALADVPRSDPIVRSAAERGVFDWPSLPYTRYEVEGIASLFPAGAARTFLGTEALEERIKSLDPKTRILHLAAHGYTDEHLPSSSFIALTIPEDTNPDAAGPDRDNGLLQVWEIFERVRLDADLVVLSACDTGLGEEQGGEGLIGLTRAFQYAGARTVMASLWSVRDQATSELMIRFYKHLRAGLTKEEALRQAQVELIRGPIEVVNEKSEKTLFDASAPYFWAGFQVYGDWQ